MRTGIGTALRQQYAVDEPLTERLVRLMEELDKIEARPKATSENAPSQSRCGPKKPVPET